MFDATKLLGSFLENRSPGSMPQRLDSAMQGSQGGMLQQVLSQFTGGAGGGRGGGLGGLLSRFTGGTGGGSGLLGQIGDMARRAAEAPGAELRQNNPAAVGGAGALAGALMGGGRGAMGGGLLAILGSLAYTAFQNQGGATAGAAAATPATPAALAGHATPDDLQRKATLVLRAMIQATKADGHLDDTESERLTRHIAEAGDDAEARQFMQAELARPVDIAGLAAEVRSPQEAAEIYAASIMAITVDTQAERGYLADLAAALRLPADVVSQVNGSLGVRG